MIWQALQPIFENTCCPRVTDVVDDVEVDDVEEDVVPEAAAIAEDAVAAATCVPDVEDVEAVAAAAVVEPAGVGGSSIRMKAAKLVTSSEMPDARLTPLDWSVKLVLLSGKLLSWQRGVCSRSFGKPRLVTPCSAL